MSPGERRRRRRYPASSKKKMMMMLFSLSMCECECKEGHKSREIDFGWSNPKEEECLCYGCSVSSNDKSNAWSVSEPGGSSSFRLFCLGDTGRTNANPTRRCAAVWWTFHTFWDVRTFRADVGDQRRRQPDAIHQQANPIGSFTSSQNILISGNNVMKQSCMTSFIGSCSLSAHPLLQLRRFTLARHLCQREHTNM